ncbi:chalcone isomerase family protein [Shewanella acanthi]|uniref:chalcone isomerase family protein n=1 Tax=Shewanella acanthi TaxID=2864212 RepID=UPI001C659AA0|nr:chalcone isomerase family protein [Shewanella acanthi]QYJ79851.1 chalcone isomerase family protein [Shewanella acanthi]
MKFFSALTLTAALLSSQFVQAIEVSGVQIADKITLQEQPLTLNGAGIRSKFFMDLYVGSLYVPTHMKTTAEVIDAPIAAIRLNITSGLITSEKMHDAIIEGFEAATADNTTDIQSQIDAFMALFKDEIKLGDQFTFVASKAQGVTAYKNGQEQATIEGEMFRQALLKIWLGEKPAQKSLKEAMLGK